MKRAAFADRIVAWQKHSGRSSLPWQGTRDPYRIWLSEVMLQQTQVSTVIPYYTRFVDRFPDVDALAAASEDEVLRLWSGLGYYSRGRNLHLAAREVVASRRGFPTSRGALEALPGVGRSTAAAIAAFSSGAREAILDGNVKRVLARCFAIAGYPGLPKIEKEMWALAESLLPPTGVEAYTQGLMDLGATLCTRSRPRCPECPIRQSCKAFQSDSVGRYPVARPRRAVPRRDTVMLAGVSAGQLLLVKRPAPGVWGGLWSFPEFPSARAALEGARASFGLRVERHARLDPLEHRFTHFSLVITPLMCTGRAARPTREAGVAWVALAEATEMALPSPVRALIGQVTAELRRQLSAGRVAPSVR